jgi:hypothetical protein
VLQKFEVGGLADGVFPSSERGDYSDVTPEDFP